MKVFEFHFNPKVKSDLLFDSFCYEPENIYEKKMGSLYVVGLLKNLLPKNLRFLESLVKVIKDKYYRSSIFTPEKGLKESLKVANEFLEKATKRGNVSWLGNLSFAVISLSDFKLNFTKVGDIKVLLIRAKKVIDIDKKIRLQEIEPYPLKVFSNTVSGKLSENDMLLVLTDDIFNFFKEQKIIEEIARLDYFGEKKLRDILNGKKELMAEKSGVFLAVLLTKENLPKQKETIFPEELKDFSFKEVFTPLLALLKKEDKKPKKAKADGKPAKKKSKKDFPVIKNLNLLRKKPKDFILKILKSLKLPEFHVPEFISDFSDRKIKPLLANKKLVLGIAFVLVLIIGFSISSIEQQKKMALYGGEANDIREQLETANSLLSLEETNPEAAKTANQILKSLWEKISVISKSLNDLPEDFKAEIFSLSKEISNKLSKLNKLEKIENPEKVFEFGTKTFVPHKILSFETNLYFFSPYQKDIFQLAENGKTGIIDTNEEITLGHRLDDFIAFLARPNQLLALKNTAVKPFSLETPYLDFNFDGFSSYNDNLYFLDKKTGQIIKYPYLGNLSWDSPQLWLNPKSPKLINAKSIAIDGSLWALSQNRILKYYAGNLQKEFELDIFPEIKEFSKVYTSASFSEIYILEPVQKRIVIIEKTGKLVKQMQSESFDNLLDFSLSEDGKTIYLLNGLKVYKIGI